MKSIRIIITVTLNILLLITTIVACKKDAESGGGTPIITRIRPVEASLADSTLTSAKPGMFLVIEGKNLQNAKGIYINNQPVAFNPVYNTSTHIIIQVPGNIPTPDRFPDVNNMLKVITGGGEVEYNFPILPPPPMIDSIYNENPKPGTIMTIQGSYFFGVKEAIFPGGKISTDFSINETGTLLYAKVPADIGKVSGKLVLTSPYGNDTSSVLVNKMWGVGIISNFDDINLYQWNGTQVTDDASLFPDNTGKYLRNVITNLQAGYTSDWWKEGRGAVFGGGKVLDDAAIAARENVDTLKNFALKMEINTLQPWDNDLIYRITFNSAYTYVLFRPAASSPNPIFHSQNKWVTITIPLSLFLSATNNYDQFPTGSNSTPVTKLSQLFDATGAFTSLFFRTATFATGPVENMHYAIDNVRIERIKN